jgi:hypothetical protein
MICNEVEDISQLGWNINIVDGARNFKGVVATFYYKDERKIFFIFKFQKIIYSIQIRCSHHLSVLVSFSATNYSTRGLLGNPY